VFLLAGHNIASDGRGTGAHGFIDEGVEAVRVRDALTAFLKGYDVQAFTEDARDPLSSVIAWYKGRARSGDVVIDIHFNAATAAATGTEVFVPNTPSETELSFASLLATDVSTALGIPKRSGRLLKSHGFAGVKHENESQHSTLAVLSASEADVSVLIEVCFVTNSEDCRKYNENFDALIKRIGETILQFV
jgi:N-acetylmuramoyl-L-alanine amidase